MPTKAQETAHRYTELKGELVSKTAELASEKRNKGMQLVESLGGVKKNEDIQNLRKEMTVKLTQDFKEKNKELLERYNASINEHKENEKLFSQIFIEAQKLNQGLKEEDLRRFLIGEDTKKVGHTEHLLNKPNMTAKDKKNMGKSIKFLVDNEMDTSENFKKLEAINYGSNYIEIGGVKRARENHKAEPNKKNIFKHGDEVYFKFDTLKEQNKLLAKQGMEIPGKDNFATSLSALPGEFKENNWYIGGNILGNILDLSMSGWCSSDGELFHSHGFGYVWSSSERDGDDAWGFDFDASRGELDWDDRDGAFAVRPVLK